MSYVPASNAGLAPALRDGILFYYLTSLVTVLGVVLGFTFIRYPAERNEMGGRTLIDAFAHLDSVRYRDIAMDGYAYDPAARSNVAFFPVYPLLAHFVVVSTGLDARVALLIIAHLSLAAAFVTAALYVQQRLPGPEAARASGFVLLAAGLFPTSFFFRMAYTESLFFFLSVLALFAMSRRWNVVAVAVVVGLATGTRVVGIALLLPFMLYLWHRSPGKRAFALTAVVVLPIACWGLLAYMAYLHVRFGCALAFVQTQPHFWLRASPPAYEKASALLNLEPIRAVFDPASPGFWASRSTPTNPLFSLNLANPVLFIAAIVVLISGAYKKWLNGYEGLLSLGLLAIPYVANSYENYMVSMGRFVSVVFPLYLVLGIGLARLPPPLASGLCCLSAFFVGAYAALFAGWFPLL